MVKEQGTLAEGNTVAVLGLAFKKDTDDIREAVSVRVVGKLLEHGLRIRVHDPMALKNFKRVFGTKISYSVSAVECLEGSDCCIILTDWDVYKDKAAGFPKTYEIWQHHRCQKGPGRKRVSRDEL